VEVEGQLRLLMVEDSEDDATLLARAVRQGGYDLVYRRVETANAMRAALAARPWDAILCDYQLPEFGALGAIAVAQEQDRDIPFLVVSGAVKEETAIEALKAGAHDFILKDRLARLVPAIGRELKEAQIRRERRQALDELKLAVKARDEFLAIASHELKTPLTAVILQVGSMLKLVRSEPSERIAQQVASKLEVTEGQLGRLTTLINNLLDVTRITSGRLRLERQSTDLALLVRTVTDRSRQLSPRDQLSLVVQADCPVSGFWDPILLETIVGNLLSNAIKFGAGRPIEVAVSADGDLARLVVTDHGIGIEPRDQERIFERFERAVPDRHFGGFGVGLWIVRQVAEAHGGRIRVSSSPGAGSTFVVELPLSPCGPPAT
jgi:signal transduction histidine kinase